MATAQSAAAAAAAVKATAPTRDPPDPALQAWREAMIEDLRDHTGAALIPALCGVVVDYLLQPLLETDGLYMWQYVHATGAAAAARTADAEELKPDSAEAADPVICANRAAAAARAAAEVRKQSTKRAELPRKWDCFRFQPAPLLSPPAAARAAAAAAAGGAAQPARAKEQGLAVRNIRPQTHSHVPHSSSVSQLCGAVFDPAAYSWNQTDPSGTYALEIACNAHGAWTAASFYRLTITWLRDGADARAALNAECSANAQYLMRRKQIVLDPLHPEWGPVCAYHARVSFDGSAVTVSAVTTCDGRAPNTVRDLSDVISVDTSDPECRRVPRLTYRVLDAEREYVYVQKN